MALIKIYQPKEEVKNYFCKYEVYAHYGIPDKTVTHNI